MPNSDRKHRILKMCSKAATVLKLNPEIYTIAECLNKLGFKSYDGLHLACAKQAKVDIFLTTDDKLLKKAKNNQDVIQLAVDNPLHWLQEVL
jgi:predicted nucleic acid-binding protein